MKDHWKRLSSGNIVKWDDELWIFQKANEDSAVLISFKHSGVTAHPSRTWPFKKVITCEDKVMMEEDDPTVNEFCTPFCGCRYDEVPDETKTVDTIEWIADSAQSYIINRFKDALQIW